MWSLIRLEREHLTNTAGYRVVPLHFDTSPPPGPTVDAAPPPDRDLCWGCKSSHVSAVLEIGGFLAVVLVCYVISFVTASPNS